MGHTRKKIDEFDPIFPLKDRKWVFLENLKPIAVFFPKDRLFHKVLVFSLLGFCTGCCNLKMNKT